MLVALRYLLAIACAFSWMPTHLGVAADHYDLVIKGGRIIDGCGTPWYPADVGITQGKIAAIGRLEGATAGTVIDASGFIVAPGFIDMMGQTATPLLLDPASARNLLTQGITTINCGEGSSAAPLGPVAGRAAGWTTMREYLALLDMQGLPVNVTQTIGHTQVRELVLGDTDRRPSPEELQQMKQFVREAMEAGAIGLSTALIYPPAVYASTEELIELTKVASEYGGRYYTHMRNEGDQLLEAIDEALDIGRHAASPVHIFHLKTAGRQNWSKMPQAIARIQAARAAGQQVAADVYPYINNGLSISALIHPRHSSAGLARLIERLDDPALRSEIRVEMETTAGWENWYRHVGHDWKRIVLGRTQMARYRQHTGQSIAAIAEDLKEDPWDTFFALVKGGAFVLPESMSEANKILAIQQEFMSYCTDVGPSSQDPMAGHPRAFGAFPRLLSRYVRELGAVSMERAIAGATSVAANEIMAFDRGRIAIGQAADIVVFDAQQIIDKATFAQPELESVGVKHVLVGGAIVLKDGAMTDARPGKVLRGPGYDRAGAPDQLVSGTSSLDSTSFDQLIQSFVQQHAIPGMAVAITRRDQAGRSHLVLAKGYGYADLAQGEPVTADHLFRIASISKPITAVAVMKLVEDGQVALDEPVLNVLDLEKDIAQAGQQFDTRWRKITVRHLLQHRGGWDRDQSFDAMFRSRQFAHEMGVDAPADPATVIRAMLAKPLDFHPGLRYAYSNFGYCLLGRVIEKVTGQTYEQYIRRQILEPIGCQTMRLGRTRQRQVNEVRYYQPGQAHSVFQVDLGEQVPLPYGAWYLEAMDAHGGWLASANDLARFAMSLDNPDHCPVLSRASIDEMFRQPEEAPRPATSEGDTDFYYSLGWMNRILDDKHINRWHTGSLDGTSAILIHRHDGWNMIALINTRSSPRSQHLGREVDQLLHQAISPWLQP